MKRVKKKNDQIINLHWQKRKKKNDSLYLKFIKNILNIIFTFIRGEKKKYYFFCLFHVAPSRLIKMKMRWVNLFKFYEAPRIYIYKLLIHIIVQMIISHAKKKKRVYICHIIKHKIFFFLSILSSFNSPIIYEQIFIITFHWSLIMQY